MNICFMMYPWEDIEPDKDSTLRMIHEAALRGHTVALTTPSNLTMRDSVTAAFCRVVSKKEKPSNSVKSFYSKATFRNQMLPLAGFDVIFMRANPPVDTIMLNFLDSVKDDTFIINDIQGLREANNKLYTAAFDDPTHTIIPKTFVSKNKEYLKKVISESENEKMIMKPLNGMGGSGVIVVEKNARQNINSLLDFYISGKEIGNYVILQEYIEGAEKGDVRVLMLHGEPIGAMHRVPASGDIRSNVSAGGSVQKHTLTKQEKRICKEIGPKLVADGLYLVGLDIINGRLIEVNVCSPGGIPWINKLNRTNIQAKIMDYAEDVVKYKEAAFIRKNEFKKAVEDA